MKVRVVNNQELNVYSYTIWSLFWPVYPESSWMTYDTTYHDFDILVPSSVWPQRSKGTATEQQINSMCQTSHDTMFRQTSKFFNFHKFLMFVTHYLVIYIVLSLLLLLFIITTLSLSLSLFIHFFLFPWWIKMFYFSCHKLFVCPAVKTALCFSFSNATKCVCVGGEKENEWWSKEERRGNAGVGVNGHVWTQAIMSNYCFSFQFPCAGGGPSHTNRL